MSTNPIHTEDAPDLTHLPDRALVARRTRMLDLHSAAYDRFQFTRFPCPLAAKLLHLMVRLETEAFRVQGELIRRGVAGPGSWARTI